MRQEMESFVNAPITSVNIMFEIDWVIIISHNGPFSDDGQNSPFVVVLWSLVGQNVANEAQKWINCEHLPNKCTHQVWIGLHENFSDHGQKPPFSVSHFVASRGLNLANRAQKRIKSEHSPNTSVILWPVEG